MPLEDPASSVSSIPEEPAEEEPVEENILDGLTTEEISTILEPENLAELSDEEIVSLIEDIASAELTDEQAEAIAEAMTNAPEDVKEEFEATVDLYGGQFDSYVPLDSRISVGQRRVVIAATTAAVVIPAAASSRSSRRS